MPCVQHQNALPTKVHLDFNRKVNSSIVHYGSTFGEETKDAFSSGGYESFVKKICQPISTTTTTSTIKASSPMMPCPSCSPTSVRSSIYNESCSCSCADEYHAATDSITDPRPRQQHFCATTDTPGLFLLSNPHTSCSPSDAQRLQITLLMRPTRCSTTIEYRPTHVLFNKMLCMIRQTKAFDLRRTTDKKTSPTSTSNKKSFHLLSSLPPVVTSIPLDEVDTSNPYHVIVREIAFGQVQDNSVHPPALFFDLPSSEISVCSLKDELNFNRKKKKQHHNARDINYYEDTRDPFTYISSTDGQMKRLTKRQVFRVYDTTDEDLQSVIVSTMRAELDKLMLLSMKKKHHQSRSLLLTTPLLHDSFLRHHQELLQQHAASMVWFKNIIQAKELENRARFDTIQKSLLAAWWPVSEGRECVTDKTPVPPANGFYVVPRNDISHAKQWDSFLRNLDAKSNLSPSMVEQDQMNQSQPSFFPCDKDNDHAHCSQKKKGSSSKGNGSAEVFGFDVRTSPHRRLRVFEDLTEKNEVLKWVERYVGWNSAWRVWSVSQHVWSVSHYRFFFIDSCVITRMCGVIRTFQCTISWE